MGGFRKWLDEKTIPDAAGGAAADIETFLSASPDYRDTIPLLLLKGRFTTPSDFMAWLN